MTLTPAPVQPPGIDPAAPAVVLSPHLDDAVWAVFSLLAGSGRLTVASVFAGIPPAEPGWWDRKCGITDSAAHVRSRRAEDRAVLEWVGAGVAHLPLLDHQYRGSELVRPAAVVDALRAEIPALSRIFAPMGIGH